MSCLCLPRLQAAIGLALPIAALRVPVPPVMATLAMSVGGLPLPGASLRAALRLGLPPLPISLALVEQISATATAASQLALGLGIDLLAQNGPSQLALSLRSLHLNLPRLLPLPLALTANLSGAMSLSLALSLIAQLRATLGVDLLAPSAALALRLALSAAPSVPLHLSARLAAYAKLALAAQAFGGIGRLLPSLQLLASLQLPSIAINLWPLGVLSMLLGLRANIQALLGSGPLANLQLSLTAALRPLWALPQLALSASTGAGLPALGVNFAANAQALLGLNLGLVAGLRLPNLAPFSLMASVALAGGLTSPGCC